MSKDLTAAMDALTREGYTPASNVTLTAPQNYGGSAGNDLSAALDALTKGGGTRTDRVLEAPRQAPPIPSRSGASPRLTSGSGTSGGGIASPLVENAYAERTFHGDKTILSTDGLYAIKIKPVKTVRFLDANGAAVVMEYKAPT